MRIRNPLKDGNVGVQFYVLIQLLMTMCGIAKYISTAKVYSKHKVIRVVSPTEAHLHALRGLIQENENTEVELWNLPNRFGGVVDVRLSPKYFRNVSKLLRRHGLRHKTLTSDLQSAIEKQNNKPTGKSSTSWLEKYHPLEEIIMRLQESTAKSNGLVRLLNLGKSYERREQYAVEIRSNPQDSKPLVFINCGIHAREWISPASCMYFIDQLSSRYSEDLTVKELISKVDVVIMPVLNVDGYVYSWEKDRLWRKNRRPNPGSECVGTDLNRNWRVGWGKAGASSNPCSPTYRGKRAMSEKEVRNVANYLESQRNRLIAYLDVHSYGQLWMFPWGFTAQHVKDYDELMRVGQAAVTAIKLQGGANTSYTLGQAYDVIYTESGTTKDHVYGHLNVKYAFSMELRDTGENGFILPNNLIEPTAKEAFEGVKAMIQSINLGSKPKQQLSSLSAFQSTDTEKTSLNSSWLENE